MGFHRARTGIELSNFGARWVSGTFLKGSGSGVLKSTQAANWKAVQVTRRTMREIAPSRFGDDK